MGKYDQQWEDVWKNSKLKDWNFNKNPCIISHSEIYDIGDKLGWSQQQVRLMKSSAFNERKKIPPVFVDNDVFVLSKTNKEFAVVKGIKSGYFDFLDIKIKDIDMKYDIKQYNNRIVGLGFGNSESRALDIAYTTKVISNYLSNNDLELTMRLRHRLHSCIIKFESGEMELDGAQFETDGMYESENEVVIFEVKAFTDWNKIQRDFKPPLHQLYYPFRTVQSRNQQKKNIKCVYMFYRFFEERDREFIEYILIEVKFPRIEYYQTVVKSGIKFRIKLR